MLGDATAVRCLLHPHSQDVGMESHRRSQVLEAARSGGWRALHLATRGGHAAAVQELLLADANVNARLDAANDGLTPLHIAAEHGHHELLDLLLQCGADPTLVTHHLRRSALHVAVFAGHERCVRLLLASPSLFDIRDGDGLTALQLASVLPPSGRDLPPIQGEIVVLLEAHQPFSSEPPSQMRSLLG